MLRPKVNVKEFEKYGFKKCKGEYRKLDCYYLCISRGCKMIFVSPVLLDVTDWKENDPRIHKNPNCRYKDCRTYMDILYELIKADLVESVLPQYNFPTQKITVPQSNYCKQQRGALWVSYMSLRNRMPTILQISYISKQKQGENRYSLKNVRIVTVERAEIREHSLSAEEMVSLSV